MCDDHIVLHRQITNELHLLKLSECIRVDPELYVKLFSHNAFGMNTVIS